MKLVVVAESMDSGKEPSAVAGMVHLAPASDWHRTLCGKDVPFHFGAYDEESYMKLLARGTNAYPCGPCGEARRSMEV